jgi:hypothetical protein
MAVRPNIQSPLTLDGAELSVNGESNEPLPEMIDVVVVQRNGGVAVARGRADRASTGWSATLPAEGFKAGAAETLGVEIRVDPFQVITWVQAVTIQ